MPADVRLCYTGRSFTTFSAASPVRYTGMVMSAIRTKAPRPTFYLVAPPGQAVQNNRIANKMPITGK